MTRVLAFGAGALGATALVIVFVLVTARRLPDLATATFYTRTSAEG